MSNPVALTVERNQTVSTSQTASQKRSVLTLQVALRDEKFTHFSNPVSLYFQRLVFERSSCSQSFFNELQEFK